MPKVYVINTETPNAFATGRGPSRASVAATVGILRLLSEEELEGVMAHELAHVKNRDTLISTIAATLGGAVTMLARIAMFSGGGRNRDNKLQMIGTILMVILAPLVAAMIQMAVSRSREYGADEAGAYMCGNPGALAGALMKLQNGVIRSPMPENMGSPATSHLFIVNPFRGDAIAKLFSTHPPTEERVRRLRAMRM
jgi:heat shock protein HtpX